MSVIHHAQTKGTDARPMVTQVWSKAQFFLLNPKRRQRTSAIYGPQEGEAGRAECRLFYHGVEGMFPQRSAAMHVS